MIEGSTRLCPRTDPSAIDLRESPPCLAFSGHHRRRRPRGTRRGESDRILTSLNSPDESAMFFSESSQSVRGKTNSLLSMNSLLFQKGNECMKSSECISESSYALRNRDDETVIPRQRQKAVSLLLWPDTAPTPFLPSSLNTGWITPSVSKTFVQGSCPRPHLRVRITE